MIAFRVIISLSVITFHWRRILFTFLADEDEVFGGSARRIDAIVCCMVHRFITTLHTFTVQAVTLTTTRIASEGSGVGIVRVCESAEARGGLVKYLYHMNLRYIMYTYVPYLSTIDYCVNM